MSNPVLSIIITTYNTADLTINCLKSILQDKGLQNISYEIIVVDNASTDSTVSKIKQLNLKNCKLIANSQNFGFAKANNQGLKIATGNYILLLNSDTVILHSSISQSLNWLSSHPEAAGCTAQLLNQDKSIQASGGFFPNLINTLAWIFHLDDLPFFNHPVPPIHPHPPQFYTHDRFYLRDRPLDWITGAFILMRRPIVDFFDEKYFMYGEELELCYRIRQQHPQLKFWYLIGPQVIHLGGASSNRSNALKQEKNGMIFFFKKHRPFWQYQIIKKLLS